MKTPNYDKKINEILGHEKPGKRVCAISGERFEVTANDLDYYRKLGVPVPKLSPPERMRLLMCHFHEGKKLYNRKCDLSGKDIISIYPANHERPVFHQSIWHGDEWDAMEYGRSYRPELSFFEQWQALRKEVPAFALDNVRNENSEYAHRITLSKNVYLSTIIHHQCENIIHCFYMVESRDCIDCYLCTACELLYEVAHANKCYACLYCASIEGCRNCLFSANLKGCHDCFMCYGLRNKSFCVKNQQLSEVEYKAYLSKIKPFTYKAIQRLKARSQILFKGEPQPYAHLLNCEGVEGDYCTSCNSCYDVFNVIRSENCRYMVNTGMARDCRDTYDAGASLELFYNSIGSSTAYNVRFSMC